MAVLAISALGAGLGSAAGIGASAGWLIGSLVGNMLFAKGTKTEGPRLTDLAVQSSTEGAPITVVHGRMRAAGNMIWCGGIQERKQKKKTGGKGMGASSSHTSYTYDASFAIGLCEGPIAGVRRIWCDSKLIYSNDAGSAAPTLYASKRKARGIAVYLGTETQTADPVIAASVGAANCPAYRGHAYLVFDRLQLADFGNRIPNITAEVVTGEEGDYLWRVNTWPQEFASSAAEVDGGVVRVMGRELVSGATFRIRTREYDLSGNKMRDDLGVAHTLPSGTSNDHAGVTHKPRISRYLRSAQNVNEATQWVVDRASVENDVSMGTFGDTRSFIADNPNCVYLNGYIFASVSNLDQFNSVDIQRRAANGVARFPVNPGSLVPAGQPDKYINLADAGWATPRGNTSYLVRRINVTDEGTLLLYMHQENFIAHDMVECDQDLNVIRGWNFTPHANADYNDVAYAARNGKFLVDVNFTNRLRLWEETAAGVYSYRKHIVQDSNNELLISAGGGLVVTRFGVYSIYPAVPAVGVTVGSIVADICQRCGLTLGEINTSALTDIVTGYAWGPRTGRAAIEPLGQCYFFDAVETDGKIVFVKRPGTVRAALTDDDLGTGINEAGRSLVMRNRQQEAELPEEVTIQYLDQDNDYQPGLQRFRRLATESRNSITLEVAIAMTSAKAAQVAEVLGRNAWVERDAYDFTVTRQFARLDPCDLITLPDGTQARIVQTQYAEPSALTVRALRDVSSAYTAIEVGNDAGSAVPQVVSLEGPTELEFMNLPPLRDRDIGPGFYLAARGYFAGWRGCQIFKSTDGGVTFNDLALVLDDATVGAATTALAAPTAWQALSTGDKVTVQLFTPGATLSGITDAALLAGGNVALLGDEILQFGAALLNGDGTYTLTRMLRGRLGTEGAIGTHAAGERFVLLDSSILWVDLGAAEIGDPIMYRAVSLNNASDEGSDEEFTADGRARQNPAPVQLIGAITQAGTWSLSWERRNRAAWWFGQGAFALDNTVEAYDVEIYDTAGTLRRTERVTSAAYSYTAAKQIADFTVQVCEFTAKVYQISDGEIRGLPATAAIRHGRRGMYLALMRSIGPVLYWRGIPDSTPDDYSANNYDGTSAGTTTDAQTDTPIITSPANHRSGILGGGYYQRADAGSPLLDIAARYVTLSCWIKFTVTGTDLHILGKWDTVTAADQAYQLGVGTAAGSLRFRVATVGGINTVQHAGPWNDGAWHQVVGVHADGVTRIYVDGVLRQTSTGGFQAAMQTGAANFRAGQTSNAASVWNGSITDVAVFAQELPATLIEDLYKTATGVQ